MKTGNANFVRHIYEVNKELKSYTVYKLVDEVESNNPKLLTDIIRIEPYMNLSRATDFNLYFRIRDQSNWQKCSAITGVKPTQNKDLFFGDCAKPYLIGCTKQSLILFYFENNSMKLIIDVFRDYYPFNDQIRQNIINGFKTV